MKKKLCFSFFILSIAVFSSCTKERELEGLSINSSLSQDALGLQNPKVLEGKALEFANFLDSLCQLRVPEAELDRLENIIQSSSFANESFTIVEGDIALLQSVFGESDLTANLIYTTIGLLNQEYPDKTDLIGSLDYLLGLYIFLERLDDHNKMSDFDACFNQCMRKKADDVFNEGNWVDQAHFLVGAPVNVAWWTGSCVWDCV